MTLFGHINCTVCGELVTKGGPGKQKYCPTCSEDKARERRRKWANENYKGPTESGRKYNEKRKIISREIAEKTSAEISHSIRDYFTEINPSFWYQVKISLPWTSALLKNHCWSFGRGHVFLRQETKKLQEYIIAQIKASSPKFFHNKIWIDIFAQKPDHKSGDAINLIDRVCDAVKKAVDVDDRWFCVRRVDWEIVKVDPKIFIAISQSATEHGQVCSICGRILPLSMFSKSKSNKLGVGRECKQCTRPMDQLKRVQKNEIGGAQRTEVEII